MDSERNTDSHDPLRLLVVDDCMAIISVVKFNLKDAGYDVTTASNGREALKKTQEEDFDLIITDEQMPQMSGTEFVEALRSNEQYAGIPLIMLTAKGLELDREQLRTDFGITEVMSKPFRRVDLLRAVQKCLATESSPLAN